jgi:hypothetical protein
MVGRSSSRLGNRVADSNTIDDEMKIIRSRRCSTAALKGARVEQVVLGEDGRR